MADGNASVELSVALESLREELEEAWVQGKGHPIRFQVAQVTLTVQATARRENKMGGKLRWWLVEAGGEHGSARENIQTLVLELSPQFCDEEGKAGPLIVAGDQAEPGK
jgi:Trypsin-co-occurring domain 2